jgi:enoyl-CoA hydratase/carnithine racemase
VKELIYTGRVISAGEAVNYGLIEKVVPEGKLMDSALELAFEIANKGPLAIGSVKKVLNRARDLALEEGLRLETDYWSNLASTEDFKEGARAFMEKRKPVYRRR